jgi:O-antigen ligase
MNLSNRAHLFLLFGAVITSFWFAGGALLGLLLLVLLVLGGQDVFQRQIWQSYRLTKVMLIYLAWIFLVSMLSPLAHLQVIMLPVLASLPIMYLVATHSATLKENWGVVYLSTFLLGVVFSIWAIFQVYFQNGYFGHAVGPLNDRNTFAALLNFIWFSGIYLLFRDFSAVKLSQYHWSKLAAALGLIIISTAFFATKSRGGLFTWLLLTPLLMWGVYQLTQLKKAVLVVVLIPFIGFVISTYLLDSSVGTRNFNLSQDDSVNARLMLWQASIQMALDHPFFGTGWGTFVNYYPAYRNPIESTSSGFFAHNDYLQFALEGGVLALVLLLVIFLLVGKRLLLSLKQASEAKSFEPICLLLGVLSIFIQASVNYIFYFGFMSLFAGLYLARAAQLGEAPVLSQLLRLEHISSSVKKLLLYTVLTLVSAPLIIHLFSLGMFGGSQPLFNLVNKVTPNINLYNIANLITTIRPSEYVAQLYLLKSNELYLNDQNKFKALNESEQREFLVSTVNLFESVAKRMAMDANLGVRQVKLLMQYRTLYDTNLPLGEQNAFERAHQILDRNLLVNRSHAESMILKSRLLVLDKRIDEAKKSLQASEQLTIGWRDQLLLKVERLRLGASTNQLVTLDELEQSVKQLTQFGISSLEQASVREKQFELIDSKLNEMASLVPLQ